MELGQTQNAVDLIPGSPANARSGATDWRDISTRASSTRTAFAKLDDDGSWSGAAYDKYLERFEHQLSYWRTTSDTFIAAANALENYAGALEWAQGEAARAIEMWNAAEAQAVAARVTYDEQLRTVRRSSGLRHIEVDVPFVDPSGSAHEEAQQVLANARYQLDVLATGYANIIGEASDAAPLPLTPEQAQQAVMDAAARTMIDATVVHPFLAALNFLGGVAQNLWEHPDLVLEILGGVLGIVGGGALIVGGGGLEVVTVGTGTPIAVPAVVGGAALASGGAGLLGDSMNRMFREAKSSDRQPGVNRGDGRDDGGHWTNRDPDAPIPDYALKEQQGLDLIRDERGVNIISDKVRVNYDGSGRTARYYDGIYQKPDGTYAGVEVKSGSAYDDYFRNGNPQRIFDSGVNPENPATGIYNGDVIQITEVKVVHVP
ncbi:putative T7SS-secreted protein [Microbacterium sp.]|jgi:hypothetical protein|uniref:putative T7SS-secreted protein n=1 Tax=Microbacterium sp. TaxID=51671 RepID=UPI0037C71D2C